MYIIYFMFRVIVSQYHEKVIGRFSKTSPHNVVTTSSGVIKLSLPQRRHFTTSPRPKWDVAATVLLSRFDFFHVYYCSETYKGCDVHQGVDWSCLFNGLQRG